MSHEAPKSVLLHYGMPKTGSTSIQVSLHKSLADERFHYVSLGQANPNNELILAFADDPNRYRFIARQQLPPNKLAAKRSRVRALLGAELRKAAGKTAILSSEALYGMRATEIGALSEFLREYTTEVKAVGYIRPPADVLVSAFQQNLKAHDVKAFELGRAFPNYDIQISMLDTVLGRENVECWLFDPRRFPGGCAVQDFCGRLGIDFDPSLVIRKNDGLSLPAISLLYAYRRLGPGYGTGAASIHENNLLVTKLRELDGPKLYFHSSLTAPLFAKRRQAVAWAEQRIEASLTSDLVRNDAKAVRSEDDLLRPSPDALAWLSRTLDTDEPTRRGADSSPEELAGWMHRLRLKLAVQHPFPVAPATPPATAP